jgi:hypothetical protein
MWFTVTLRGAGQDADAELSALALRIPCTEDASRLLHWWSGAHGFRNPRVVHIGATPPGEGVLFSSLDKARVQLHDKMRGSFIPYVLLAGDRRGLAWFAENDQGWTYSLETPAVALERQGQTVTLVLRIITEPVTLAEPRTFAFGLHPIPVKELEPGWRMTPNWGVFPDSFCGFNLKGPRATQFYRHPENLDWAMAQRLYDGQDGSLGARKWVDDFRNGFRRAYGREPRPREDSVAGLYHDLSGIAAFPEHTREWGETWWTQRYTPEMLDYCAWIWDQWVKHGLAAGIYYDNCFNYPLDAWPSPVSYKRPDGTVQPGFQWRQIREHMKRTRQVFLDNGLVPHLCAHTTHTYFIPYHSFFDTILDGEDFYQRPGERRDFMDSWPPARLRFMNSDKWGLISTWLGWYQGAGDGWGPHQTSLWQHWRAYTAALLVHDLVWTVPYSGGRHEIDEAWIRESRLRLDPATAFVGYWDPATPATHQHPALHVSVWKRPGWCAIALANWGQDRLEAEVRLDPQGMGFGDLAPDAWILRDVDKTLLSYFDDDVTKLERPELAADLDLGKKAADLGDLRLEEPPTLQQRKAADPDGQFTWQEGVLRCPVRRHDFRLFEVRPVAP